MKGALRKLAPILSIAPVLMTAGLAQGQDTCSYIFEATGSDEPDQVPAPGPLQNGDFIIADPSQSPLGDGRDEFTRWIYDFTDRLEELNALDPANMTTARLEVTLVGGGSNDDIGIHGLPQIPAFPSGIQDAFTIDLLRWHTPQAILDAINRRQASNSTGVSAQEGELLMGYQDDAILTTARLTISFDQPCSESQQCLAKTTATTIVNWTNAAGGSFHDDANWSDDRPGPDSTARFGLGAAYSVRFSQPATNDALLVEQDDLVSLDLDGTTYTLTSDPACNTTAILVRGDASSLEVSDGSVAAQGDVLLADGVNPELILSSGGVLLIGSGGTLDVGSTSGVASVTVQQGGLLDVDGRSTLGPGSGSQAEAFIKEAGSAFFSRDLVVGSQGPATLTIADRAEVAADVLTLVDQGTANGSSIEVSDRGQLIVDRLTMARSPGTRAAATVRGTDTVLEVGDSVLVGLRGEATLTLAGGAALKEAGPGGTLSAGVHSGATGALTLTGNGTLLDLTRLLLGDQGQGSLAVSADAEALMDDLVVGRGSTGSVTLTDGGQLSTRTMHLALQNGVSAEMTLTGTSARGPSELEVLARAAVGVDGTATLRLSQGAALYGDAGTGALVLGAGTTGEGTLDLDGAGTLLSDLDEVVIGDYHVGRMTVANSATVSNVGALVLGRSDSNARGTVEISQQGSVATTHLTAGQDGGGTLRITTGGRVTVEDDLSLGIASAATGEVTVSGIGSELSASGTGAQAFTVGQAGTGTLRVINGADLLGTPRTTLTLGAAPGGAGTMEVIEDGTFVGDLRRIAVGDRGSGTLDVSARGTVEAQFLWLPRSTGTGTVTVFGQGTTLSVQQLFVGRSGEGRLTVEGQGRVTAHVLHLGPQGTLVHQNGVLNVGQIVPSKQLSPGTDTTGVQTDTLFVSAGSVLAVDSVAFHPGGVLGGTAPWSGDLTNHGTIAPGDSTGGVGTFAVEGAYRQTDAGFLAVDLGGPAAGTSHDVLAVSEEAHLAGTLRLSVQEGFVPEPGQIFEIVTAESITGQFDAVEEPEKVRFDVVVEPTRVVATVLSVVAVEREEATDAPDESAEEAVPEGYALGANYPNPFNPRTVIPYGLPQAGRVRLAVYDVYGREVAVLVERVQAAGRYEAVFEGAHLSSGVYVYRLDAELYRATGRMLLLK